MGKSMIVWFKSISIGGGGVPWLRIGLLIVCLAAGCSTGSEYDVLGEQENDGSGDAGNGGTGGAAGQDGNGHAGDGGTGGAGGTAGENGGGGEQELQYTTALVITKDRQTGSYSTIAMEGHAVDMDINTIHPDSMCEFDPLTETPFIVQRLGVDSILVLDPESLDIVEEYSVEAGSNPYDLVVVAEDRAYITRYGLDQMLIVEPLTGTELGTVDLSEYADDDGIPESSGMAYLDGKIYVLIDRLDRDNDWTPVGDSYLVIIDAYTGDIEDEVELSKTNPYGAPEYSQAIGKFVLAEADDFSTLEGGIELFDPSDNSLSGIIVTEQELGGNVTKALIVSETKGYATIGVKGDDGNNTHIVTFNPETGEKLDTLLEAEGWSYSDMMLIPNGTELWIADRTSDNPGVRILDTETDREITDDPIDVGLQPSAIGFVP